MIVLRNGTKIHPITHQTHNRPIESHAFPEIPDIEEYVRYSTGFYSEGIDGHIRTGDNGQG